VPAGLARDIFGIESELTLINYTGNGMHFEIFIADRTSGREPKIEHTCIEVASRSRFIERCDQLNVTVNQVPKGDRILLFVRDFDGNLFEVKARED
jgi:catechol 2,3-dioxygenase-like lactoylglutathione lyase family enzyme